MGKGILCGLGDGFGVASAYFGYRSAQVAQPAGFFLNSGNNALPERSRRELDGLRLRSASGFLLGGCLLARAP